MNQREMAKFLNVSQTSVSLVLKDPETRKVSRETRDKILDFLRDTKYREKRKTSVLRKIYFAGNSESSYQQHLFLDGVFQFAEEFGIAVELKSAEILPKKRTDGTGCILHGTYPPEKIRELAEKMPLCFLNQPPEAYLCDSVSGDSRESIRMAIRHLRAEGYSKLAFWGFPDLHAAENQAYFQTKLESFRALFPEMCADDTDKIENRIILLRELKKTDYESRIALSMKQLREHPDCTAFITTGYACAKILYDAALRLNRKCRIVSCGYSEYEEAGMPLFDYITCGLVKMGKTAAAQLLKRAEYPDAPICSILCCPELFRVSPGGMK